MTVAQLPRMLLWPLTHHRDQIWLPEQSENYYQQVTTGNGKPITIMSWKTANTLAQNHNLSKPFPKLDLSKARLSHLHS